MEQRIIWRSELMKATGWSKRHFQNMVQRGKLPQADIPGQAGYSKGPGKEPGWLFSNLPGKIQKRLEESEATQKENGTEQDEVIPQDANDAAQVETVTEQKTETTFAPRSSLTVPDVPSPLPAERSLTPAPALAQEAPVPQKLLHIGNLRADVIRRLQMDLSQNGHPKGKIINNFLAAYNTGLLMPAVFSELGKISRSTIYEWLKNVNESGIPGLVPQYGGGGVCKITEDEKNTVLGILLNQNRIKPYSAIRMAKYILKNRSIESPSSPATIARFVNDFRKNHFDIWTLFREGEKALNDKVLPYIERDRELLQVGDGLVADGHRLNFSVINPFTGKSCRPALVLFWDWRSGYPCGWEIMLEENVQCISSALRQAILTLGKVPKWVLIDNGKGFKAKVFTSNINLEEAGLYGMYARLGIDAHFAMPYNAQAKPIERFFKTFTDWFERIQPSFVGSSIEDKPAYMKRNEKLLRSLHNDWVPTIMEASEMIAKWREFYADQPSRGLKNRTPREIFEGGKGENGQKILPADLHYLMMAMEPKKLNRNGVSVLGRNWYDDALYGLKDEVIVRYSFADLRQIYIFSRKNEFLCTARPVAKTNPMISECGTPKDLQDLKRDLARKRELKKHTVKIALLAGERIEKLVPLTQVIPQIPDVVGAIEKMEAERKPAMLNPSPFLEDSEQGAAPSSPTPSPEPGDGHIPWFFDEYEKYDWLMKQTRISREDREWIEDFRERSTLYRHEEFNDGAALDAKVACNNPGGSA